MNKERTFLAWLRTSLSFAGIGIAITQLFRLNLTISERSSPPPNPSSNPSLYHLRQLGKPLGATFLGIAILVLGVGGRRYFEGQVIFLPSLRIIAFSFVGIFARQRRERSWGCFVSR